MVDFVCIGDVTQDNFFFLSEDEAKLYCELRTENCELALKYGDKIPVKKYGVSCGGNAANVAVGLTKLGLKTKLVTTFGDDDRGAWLQRQLLAAGVDLEDSQIEQGRQSNLSAIIVFKTERTILTYHAAGEDLIKDIPPARWLYLTSSSGQNPDSLFATIQAKRHAWQKLAFNPGLADLKRGSEHLRPILEIADVLIANREEAEVLLNSKFIIHDSRIQNIKQVTDQIRNLGPKIVVITNGPAGAFASGQGKSYFSKAFPSKTLETTGAGDAFSSGFLAGLDSANMNIVEAMQWGMFNSSSVVTKLGAQGGLLDRAQIQQYLKDNSGFVPEGI